MAEPEYLDGTELHRLTGAARAPAQGAWLKERGIAHQVDGRRVIVSRQHVRSWLEGKPVTRSAGLNWASIR